MNQLSLNTIFKNSKIAYLIIIVLSFFIYGNTLKNNYAFDSIPIVEQNPEVKKGVKGIFDFFTQSYDEGLYGFSDKGLGYRPLVITTFALEYSLFGNTNSKFSHFIQILLYALCIVILFKVLRSIIKPNNYLLLFISLLFLTHPIHSEVINDVKNRDELLIFIGGLLSLLYTFKFYKSKKTKYYFFALLWFLFALFSKESAIIYLAIIPITLFYYTELKIKKIALYLVPFLTVSILILGYNYYLSGYIIIDDGITLNFSGLSSYVDKSMNSLAATNTFGEKSASIINILGHHLKVIFWPTTLLHSYRYAVIPLTHFGNPFVWITAVILCFAALFALRGIKKKTLLSYGIISYFIGIALYSNTFSLAPDDMAERYLFYPLLGVLILSGVFLDKYLKNKNLKYGLLLLVAAIFTGKTISRNAEWKDNLTLYTEDIKKNPNCSQTQLFLGMEYFNRAQISTNNRERSELIKKGFAHKEAAISLNPDYARAQFSIGSSYIDINQNKKGITHLKKAIKVSHETMEYFNAEMYNIMSVGYRKEKEFNQAIDASRKSIELQPNNAIFYNTLASHYFEMNDLQTALKHCQRAHELDPNYLDAIKNMAILYYNMGNLEYANYYKEVYESKK